MKSRIVITHGILKGRELIIDKDIIIGRNTNIEVQFPKSENKISRCHCMIEYDPPNLILKDLDSLNGTFVNGIKYGGKRENRVPGENIINSYNQYLISNSLKKEDFTCLLKNGDEISIGNNNIIKVFIDYVDDEILNGYERIKQIGESLMCEVYHVRKIESNEEFAIKLIKADEEPTDDEIRRLEERDAEIGKVMDHPNVVKQYKSGYENGEFYIITEYIDGKNIEELVKEKGKLDINTTFEIMLGILDGLEYLHNNGIIHRDIKPSNILLLRKENKWIPKIIDFNLSISFKKAKTITKAGYPKGSLSYMPPEQITHFKEIGRNKDMGMQADIFSLGATLYYMLTGENIREFNIHNYIKVILDQKSIIPVEKRIPNLDSKIVKLINKLVAYKPENRFSNISEIRNNIVSILND